MLVVFGIRLERSKILSRFNILKPIDLAQVPLLDLIGEFDASRKRAGPQGRLFFVTNVSLNNRVVCFSGF